MAKKDDKYYEQKVKKLKKEKRELCSPVSDVDYNTLNLDGSKNTNREIKKIKEDFKRIRRGIKRSEKQQVDKEIDQAIDDFETGVDLDTDNDTDND